MRRGRITMAEKLTVQQMDARYEALAEAAEHLLVLDWTDKQIERVEGVAMAEWLKKQADKWLARAQEAREAESEKNH